MTNFRLATSALLFLIFCISGYSQKGEAIKHIVYLVGDAGRSEKEVTPVFNLLKNQVANDPIKSTVLFLGDNIYPGGLPEKDDKDRKEAEAIIDFQIRELKKLNTNPYFIPGNHDWNKGKADGISTLRNEEKYIEKEFGNENIFLPSRGCPGPSKIKIGKDLVIYAIDTQWWLHQYEKPPIESADCKVANRQEFLDELTDKLKNNQDKNVIVVGHHPFYSDGHHGGHFHGKDHLFPLTSFNPKLYIPLPLIGSIYPLYRSMIGHSSDITHPEYESLIEGLNESFENIDGLIYAAGHEHNLQYYNKNNQHHIVSGSGSEATYSSGKGSAEYSESTKGFFKLIYYTNGAVNLQAWKTDEAGNQSMGFEKEIKKKKVAPTLTRLQEARPQETFPTTIIQQANPDFEASKFKTFFWGEHYRAAWIAPVEYPVLNLYTEKGGLTPVKMGGRMQSKSLRVESKDGYQYVLRSVKKFPERALPKNLQNTLAAATLNDQISSSHPYAAYVIPPLADAAKVLHTNPKPAFVPDSPNLLYWRDDFANQLVLFEQRAAHDLTEFKNFGNAEDAINSTDMIKNMIEDHDYVVDEVEVLRNRLFDIFIGDWDRHEGQWRWAEFECNESSHTECNHPEDIEKYYVPIPKDRDQAFALYDGLFPAIVSSKWLQPRFQTFDYEVKNLAGLNFNGRYVDRMFLTRLTKEQWVAMAKEHQENITDEIIEKAIRLWPDTIFKLDGEDVIAKLKKRREDLDTYAEEYYLMLAKEVNIIGSEKKEHFIVERLNDDSTSIKVFKIKKNGVRQLHYERVFRRSETNEVRLYGLGGKDQFTINGDVKKGIIVRVIGGYGKDKIIDSSSVRGLRNLTHVYDTEKKTVITTQGETNVHTSSRKSSNLYDRKAWKPNVMYPKGFFGFTQDDGVFVGGGFEYVKQGFRKEPFKESHRLVANVALSNYSFNILYTGTFTDIIKRTDLRVDLLMSSPKLTNFFGYGNETSYNFDNDNRDDYVTRYDAISGRALFVFSHKEPVKFRIGPQLENIKTVEAPDRFFGADSTINNIDKKFSQYVGLRMDYEYKLQNKKVLPTRGIRFKVGANYNQEVSGKAMSNLRLQSKFTVYLPLFPTLTYTGNISGTHVFNDFEYFHSASLGGLNYTKDNDVLRGYRRDRYNGRSSFAFNNGLRLKLFNFSSILFPGEVGISTFYDTGRVWFDNEDSDVWHDDYGFGIWASIVDEIVINAYYSFTEEENMFRLLFGFTF